ncbi:hypothetical protein cand_026590 [Cryptosporidium andersoni]|uniref:Transmembrane protein n=1 Tax=Cryptosporidium andersoni TaxID=117008 RepID=A0A1J4ME09_9CRYT|nr:hypothetical protein cand_026590 [Cryptosporidium andersoni]
MLLKFISRYSLFFVSVIVTGALCEQTLGKDNIMQRIKNDIYRNRYQVTNTKYLVWLLIIIPVAICIPCLIWVWCNDQCIQFIYYRDRKRLAKEQRIINEIIDNSLSNIEDQDRVYNMNLALPAPLVATPNNNINIQMTPINYIPQPYNQNYINQQCNGCQ